TIAASTAVKEWLLNVTFEDFNDIEFSIIGADGGPYMHADRFPEPPNDWEHEIGTVWKAYTVTVTADDTFVLTVGGTDTTEIPVGVPAVDVEVVLLLVVGAGN